MPADPEALEATKTEVHYLGYYLKWHPQSCYYYCQEHGGFQPSPERTPGTYSKYNSIDDRIDDFHYYTTFTKFGIGRATADAAQEIRSGDITRDEGVALVRRYDGEFPEPLRRRGLPLPQHTRRRVPRRFGHVRTTDPGQGKLHGNGRRFPARPTCGPIKAEPGTCVTRYGGTNPILKPNIRLMVRLDVKAPNLIKGVHLEGLRKLGDPQTFAERYYGEGIDEIIYIDSVASLYQRNTIVDLISHTAENVFIPITAGGGVRSVEDARTLLRAGADKVAVNTAAVRRPALIGDLARAFGSQCVVLSIEASASQRPPLATGKRIAKMAASRRALTLSIGRGAAKAWAPARYCSPRWTKKARARASTWR